MTIITDLYNRVLNFFNSEKEDENSKNTACNRLKLVLMQDRAKLDPAIMEQLRQEMIEVISKYIEIDTEALGLNLAAEGETCALMLNIPVIRAKTLEEIEEAKNAAKLNADEDDSEDDTEEEDDDIEEESDEELEDEDKNDAEDVKETTDDVEVSDEENIDEEKTDEVEVVEEVEPMKEKDTSLEFDDPYVIHEDIPSDNIKKKLKNNNK